MDLVQGPASSTDDCAMALKTGRLEWKYEKSLMLSVQLMDAERNRVKSVEQLYVEFENDDLRLQLNHANDELAQAAKAAREARVQLYDTCKEVDRLQAISKTSSHDTGLQREIASLRKAAAESEKHLAEKNSLSEKLSDAQSELAQLQTQNSSAEPQATEKHGLQRKLDTLKGQLEDEKRACDRSRGETADLSTRLDETRRQLSGETEARSRQERNHQRQIEGWETQRAGLEDKLESLQQKLKLMNDQLREAKTTSRASNARTEDKDGQRPQSRAIPSRQQPSTRFNNEIAIATPGAVQTRVGAKKSTALPGDKSAFSITPFLNRASAFQDPTSSSEDDSEESRAERESEERPHKGKIPARGRIADRKKSHNTSPSGKDVVDSPSKPRSSTREAKAKAQRGRMTADINPETTSTHSDSGDQDQDQDQAEEPEPSARRQQSTTGQAQAMGKTKKRKLGAQRDISQEEEEEDISPVKKPGRKLALGAGRKPAPGGLQQLNAAGPARLPRSRVFSGPTPFSPLKRDRR